MTLRQQLALSIHANDNGVDRIAEKFRRARRRELNRRKGN